MSEDYSALWSEIDPEKKTELDAELEDARKAFADDRLPNYKEVKGRLAALSTKKEKVSFIKDVIRRYSFYFADSNNKNLKYKTEWEEKHEANSVFFKDIHTEELARAKTYHRITLNEYNKIKMLFASTNPDFIPSQILWRGEHPEKQVAQLILAWTGSSLPSIHIDTQDTSEYIQSRFALGRTSVNDRGDYIIWNSSNDTLIWWILCLVNEELLNIDTYTYENKEVPKIISFATHHFLSYSSEKGLHYYSNESLRRSYEKIKDLYFWPYEDLEKHHLGLYLIKKTAIGIAAI